MTSSPPSLPDALLGHAARDPEEPWLFYAEGWDWRWLPWKEVARRVEEAAAELAGIPAGARVPFFYDGQPAGVIRDLAIQRAGGVSVVVEDGKEVVVSGLELVGMAAWVGEKIQGAAKREIVVLGGPLDDPFERAMLSWATVTGAAVVLEPHPEARVATAAWVRPTVFHGTPAEISGLRAWAEKEKRKGLPFRRLRTILVTGTEGLPLEEEAFWQGRGTFCRRAA